jgi:predicted DNA-binding ribbon-helix-helix protein
MQSGIVKRSLTLNGRKTSVTLEDRFWEGLREIAAERNMRVSRLVNEIRCEQAVPNLSSALRLFVLRHYQAPFARSKVKRRDGLSH